VVDKQFYERVDGHVHGDQTSSGHVLLSNFVYHALYLEFCGVETHGAHQERQLLNWHAAVQLSCFCCVLSLGANHSVVEEVLHVLVSLAVTTALNKVDKRLDFLTSQVDGLIDGFNIDRPHVYSEVVASTSKNVLAIHSRADICDFVRVSDHTHGLVGVTVKRKLDEADDFFVC